LATKIGIAGTHSTGKSTFLNRLQSEFEHRGYRVAIATGFASDAQSLGFPILQDHNFESTAWIMARGTQRELEGALSNDIVLVDRPVPDALGYYLAALEYRRETDVAWKVDHLTSYVKTFAPTYGILIRTVLDSSLPIGRSKPRDGNLAFRDLASTNIETVFSKLNLAALELSSSNSDQIIASVLSHFDREPSPGHVQGQQASSCDLRVPDP
jgi:GTPase SAR1 family protein